jgi:hypothetical protein
MQLAFQLFDQCDVSFADHVSGNQQCILWIRRVGNSVVLVCVFSAAGNKRTDAGRNSSNAERKPASSSVVRTAKNKSQCLMVVVFHLEDARSRPNARDPTSTRLIFCTSLSVIDGTKQLTNNITPRPQSRNARNGHSKMLRKSATTIACLDAPHAVPTIAPSFEIPFWPPIKRAHTCKTKKLFYQNKTPPFRTARPLLRQQRQPRPEL